MIRSICTLAVLTLTYSANAATKPDEEMRMFTLRTNAIGAVDADVEDQGQLSRQQWGVEMEAMVPLSERLMLGTRIGVDQFNYDWSPSGANEHLPTWDNLRRFNASIELNYRLDDRWMLMLSPTVQYAYADDQSVNDALSYGIVAGAIYRWNPDLILGFGVGYFNDIDETQSLPFLAIDWQINDRWHLGNPLNVDFSGPAGLELNYQLAPSWRLGFGSAMRSNRFLVGEDKEVAEFSDAVAYVKLDWQVSDQFNLGLYLGSAFDSELEINPNGNDKTQYEIDSQSVYAISAEYRF